MVVAVGQMEVLVDLAPPVALDVYREHAELVEDHRFGDDRWESGYAFVAVNNGGEWPRLVVTQQFAPAGAGFAPGVLLVPDLAQVFTTGNKLWTTFVEPPWSYQVIGGQIRLDVMGTVSTFDLTRGP